MLLIRTVGFVFGVCAQIISDETCDCAFDKVPDSLRGKVKEACPTYTREWYVVVKLLIATMACDAFFSTVALIVVLRQRIQRCCSRIRPPREREPADRQRTWQLRCKRE